MAGGWPLTLATSRRAAARVRAKRPVMVVSHDATRTGAPRVAVELARAIEASGRRVSFLLRWDGPLRNEMERASSALHLEPFRRIRAVLRMRFPSAAWVSRVEELAAFVALVVHRPSLVYVNTVKSACYVRPARWLGHPVVLHVHELEPMASRTLSRYRLERCYRDIVLVGCSRPTAHHLARIADVPERAVREVLSLVDAEAVATRARHGAGVIAAAGADRAGMVVGACGMANERKGVDLWLEAMAIVHARKPTGVRFVWIGGFDDLARATVERLGLGRLVEFVGEVDNAPAEIAALDVFTLPSRSDPFPLVVLEAMALGKPVVAFAVDGVPDQVGDAGMLVPPGDVERFADAVVELLDDAPRRRELGDAAARRARSELDISRFDTAVVEAVANGERRARARTDVMVVESATGEPDLSVALLHAFDPSALHTFRTGSTHELPYRVEALSRSGCSLRLTDAMYRGVWARPAMRRAVDALERVGVPFLQPFLMRRSLRRADVVVAMFESQANAVALTRSVFGRRRGAPLVVISCWLARDLERFGPLRRLLYRFAYRSVDCLVFFSSNQRVVFARALGLPQQRLHSVPFGIDHEFFSPGPDPRDGGAVVAVGRDLGRDWPTFLEAVRDAPYPVKVACRPGTLDGLDIPGNVEDLGWIDRESYRRLLAEASIVVVATRPVGYPTGQSVMLEAMAMAKCCVVTATPALSEYVVDGETALTVPPGDPSALRDAIAGALADPSRRRTLGAAARASVDAEFNAPEMWRRIAVILRETAAQERSTSTGSGER